MRTAATVGAMTAAAELLVEFGAALEIRFGRLVSYCRERMGHHHADQHQAKWNTHHARRLSLMTKRVSRDSEVMIRMRRSLKQWLSLN